METRIHFRGGSKHNTAMAIIGLTEDDDLYFDLAYDPHEHYKRTNETLIIDGLEYTVFELKTG